MASDLLVLLILLTVASDWFVLTTSMEVADK
jgi:hypothetical protein